MTEMERDEQKINEQKINQENEMVFNLEEESRETECVENGEGEKESKDDLNDVNEKYIRLAADFQNFKRRTENERFEIAAYTNEKMVKELLPVVDSFERALDSKDDSSAGFRDGVELIYKQLMAVLTNFNVKVIETDNVAFNPNLHDAVLTEEVEGVEADTILMVMQKGYTLNGRVVRPAMVKVSV